MRGLPLVLHVCHVLSYKKEGLVAPSYFELEMAGGWRSILGVCICFQNSKLWFTVYIHE
jgi:hypothetical protein